MVFKFLYRQFQYLLTLPWNLGLQIASCLKVLAKILLQLFTFPMRKFGLLGLLPPVPLDFITL